RFMIGPRHADFPAHRTNGVSDFLRVGSDNNAIRARFQRAFQHVHNHWLAVDVDQRFTRQARGSKTGGNNSDKTHEKLSSGSRVRASVSSNTGMFSLNGNAKLSTLQISSCLSWL